jgi:hypothetical protein
MSENIERALGRIEGRLIGIESEQKRIGDVVDTKLDAVEDRVTKLEHTRTRLTAWATAVSAMIGIAARVLFP